MSSDMASQQPRYWKDLTIEEKVERTREMVRSIQADHWKLSSQISELNGKLANHDHKDGKVVVPMNPHSASLGGGLMGASKTPYGAEKEAKGEVYF